MLAMTRSIITRSKRPHHGHSARRFVALHRGCGHTPRIIDIEDCEGDAARALAGCATLVIAAPCRHVWRKSAGEHPYVQMDL